MDRGLSACRSASWERSNGIGERAARGSGLIGGEGLGGSLEEEIGGTEGLGLARAGRAYDGDTMLGEVGRDNVSSNGVEEFTDAGAAKLLDDPFGPVGRRGDVCGGRHAGRAKGGRESRRWRVR